MLSPGCGLRGGGNTEPVPRLRVDIQDGAQLAQRVA